MFRDYCGNLIDILLIIQDAYDTNVIEYFQLIFRPNLIYWN